MINDLDRAQARIRSLQLDIERLQDENRDALRWKEWFHSGKERMERIASKVFSVAEQGQELEDAIDALIAEVRRLRTETSYLHEAGGQPDVSHLPEQVKRDLAEYFGPAATSMTGPNLTGPIRRGEFDKQTVKVDIYDAEFDAEFDTLG